MRAEGQSKGPNTQKKNVVGLIVVFVKEGEEDERRRVCLCVFVYWPADFGEIVEQKTLLRALSTRRLSFLFLTGCLCHHASYTHIPSIYLPPPMAIICSAIHTIESPLLCFES